MVYLKKKKLGSGAFGEVWLVYHKDLNRDFAMKIIKKRKNKSNEEREIIYGLCKINRKTN